LETEKQNVLLRYRLDHFDFEVMLSKAMSMRLKCYKEYERVYSSIAEVFSKARANQFNLIRA